MSFSLAGVNSTAVVRSLPVPAACILRMKMGRILSDAFCVSGVRCSGLIEADQHMTVGAPVSSGRQKVICTWPSLIAAGALSLHVRSFTTCRAPATIHGHVILFALCQVEMTSGVQNPMLPVENGVLSERRPAKEAHERRGQQHISQAPRARALLSGATADDAGLRGGFVPVQSGVLLGGQLANAEAQTPCFHQGLACSQKGSLSHLRVRPKWCPQNIASGQKGILQMEGGRPTCCHQGTGCSQRGVL